MDPWLKTSNPSSKATRVSRIQSKTKAQVHIETIFTSSKVIIAATLSATSQQDSQDGFTSNVGFKMHFDSTGFSCVSLHCIKHIKFTVFTNLYFVFGDLTGQISCWDNVDAAPKVIAVTIQYYALFWSGLSKIEMKFVSPIVSLTWSSCRKCINGWMHFQTMT